MRFLRAADHLFYLSRYDVEGGATFGMLTGPGLVHPVHTMELLWRDNRPRVSCVAPGTYEVVPTTFYGGRRTGYPAFEIIGVPGRSLIKCHRANWPEELQGCIAVGMERTVRTRPGGDRPTACVWRSRDAHDLVMAAMRKHWAAGDRTYIEISGTGG